MKKKISELKISNFELSDLVNKKNKEIKKLKEEIESFKTKNNNNKLSEISDNKNVQIENKTLGHPFKFGFFSYLKNENEEIKNKSFKKDNNNNKNEKSRMNQYNFMEEDFSNFIKNENETQFLMNNNLKNKINKKEKAIKSVFKNNIFNLTTKDLFKKNSKRGNPISPRKNILNDKLDNLYKTTKDNNLPFVHSKSIKK